jgi:hypothetical protein
MREIRTISNNEIYNGIKSENIHKLAQTRKPVDHVNRLSYRHKEHVA